MQQVVELHVVVKVAIRSKLWDSGAAMDDLHVFQSSRNAAGKMKKY